jgi:ABC-2 type transport system permease protein
MRWLVLKDLRILRRSPFLVTLLVLYPIVLAVLIGLALSGGPAKPRVAFANLVPPGESAFSIGARRLNAADYAGRLFQ